MLPTPSHLLIIIMGKYDHIIELSGADEYPAWRRAVTLALQADGL